jgi:hydroxylamine reductase (hybrid-cluster protein)
VPEGDKGLKIPRTSKVRGCTSCAINRTKLTAIQAAVGKDVMITMGCGKA